MANPAARSGGAVVRPFDLPGELLGISRWRGGADLIRTWLLIALVAFLCGTLALAYPVVYAGGVVVVAALQNHLMVLFHHSIHKNLHPVRRINDWLARWLTISPMGQPWGMLRRAHLTHHAYLGEPNDPDRWYYDLDLHGRRRAVVLASWLGWNCLGGLLVPQLRKALTGFRDRRGDPGTARGGGDTADRLAVVIVQVTLFAAFWLLTGTVWGYILLWLLPAITLGGGLNCFRTTLEHADASEPPRRDLSFVSNRIERFFVAPFNMNYHWEHHLFMSLPYYRMPALRRLLLDRGAYGDALLVPSYVGRLREIMAALRRSKVDRRPA
jgi:fatty acid desaturase